MKKTLTRASSKKSGKKSSKRKSPILRPRRLPWEPKERTSPIKFITKKNGELETKEERKKRLAKKEALFLRAWQMFHDDYHNQNQ